MNPSALMTAYNQAKWLGIQSGVLDPRRADRALGVLMAGKLEAKRAAYGAQPSWCACPDAVYRRRICKHSIAAMIAQRHDEIMDEFRKRHGVMR